MQQGNDVRRWIAVRVTITRFVDDRPPGMVEAELCDVYGQRFLFLDKQSFFGRDDLGVDDTYPQDGKMLCWVRGSRKDATGQELIRVELYGDGTELEVRREALVEGTYNSTVKRPWNGVAEPNAT